VETAVEIDSLMHGLAVYAHFHGGKNLFHGWADAERDRDQTRTRIKTRP
jgi:hypothetical protein